MIPWEVVILKFLLPYSFWHAQIIRHVACMITFCRSRSAARVANAATPWRPIEGRNVIRLNALTQTYDGVDTRQRGRGKVFLFVVMQGKSFLVLLPRVLLSVNLHFRHISLIFLRVQL